jgi:hypothetical protein
LAVRQGWVAGYQKIAKGFEEEDLFDVSDLEAVASVDNTAWEVNG